MFASKLHLMILSLSLTTAIGTASAVPAFSTDVDDTEGRAEAKQIAPLESPLQTHEVSAVTLQQLTAALRAKRQQSLQAFSEYRNRRMYPHNTYQPGKLNVWIDEEGRTCAAATIIKQSGADALVAQTAEDNNFIRLADVRSGELMDWILTSGLTQQEIVMIQEPFMEVPDPQEQIQLRAAQRARAAEDARLAAKYARIEKTLRAQAASRLLPSVSCKTLN
jgi:hypothetical protein